MAQNSARLTWEPAEVDAKLKNIMETCYEACYKVGKEYSLEGEAKVPSLVVGANISGFIKVLFRLVLNPF
jgi:glutamate dehydrogenase (NADP+)